MVAKIFKTSAVEHKINRSDAENLLAHTLLSK